MKILMVCLGNICRSPLAEGILRYKAEKIGMELIVDSCGTSNYHIGSPPDKRMIEVAFEKGIDISKLKARQFEHKDFENFDLIYVMDENNLIDIQNLSKNQKEFEQVKLLLSENLALSNFNVPDPYYGMKNDFEDVFNLLNTHMDLILERLK